MPVGNRSTLVAAYCSTLVLVWGMAAQPAAGQTRRIGTAESLRFQHLGMSRGLLATTPTAFLQDSRGFMWIASNGGGLNRYDGREVRVYRPMPGDATTISHAVSVSLFEDRDGDMWIGTLDGLNRYSPIDDAFDRFTLRELGIRSGDAGYRADSRRGDAGPAGNVTPPIADVTQRIPTDGAAPVAVLAIDEDADGNLWLLTSVGIVRRAAHGGAFTMELPLSIVFLATASYVDILCLEDGTVWYASRSLFGRIDTKTGIHDSFGSGSQTNGVRDHDYSKLLLDRDDPDYLWVVGTGLYRVRRSDGSRRHFLWSPALTGARFLGVAEDPHDRNRLWFATGPGNGLVSFDRESETFSTIRHDPTNPNGLGSDDVLSVYFDRSGLLWVSVSGRGVDRVDLTGGEFGLYRSYPDDPSTLPSHKIRDIIETTDGRIWVACPPTGFASIDPDGRITRYDRDRRFEQVWNFATSADGSVWVGLLSGTAFRVDIEEVVLYRFDPRTQTVRAFPTAVRSELPSVGALLEADDGRLWIGTLEGLSRFDPRTESVETDLLGRRADVAELYDDGRGGLWVSTRNAGVARYDIASGEVSWLDTAEPARLPDEWVTGVLQRRNSPGVFWIGMYGGGLARYDEATGDLQTWSTDDGLPDNVVYGILEDDGGLLWMSTNRGIARFDPETEEFRSFGMERGIQSWEFNQHAFHRSPRTGLMYFGGVNGLNVFDPDELLTNTAPPPIVLTDFLMDNRSVRPGPEAPLKTAIWVTDEIVLRHDQTSVGFEYAALDYKYPEQNRYRYMLAGFDDDWVEAGNETKASYTNLRSGVYTFRVHGSNGDGVWSETPAEVTLRVLPPWWRTWWAYLGYVVLLVGAFVIVDRVQRRRVIAKERERTRERELAQAREIEKAYHQLREAKDRLVQQEKLASLGGLTAGIAHEIKNPLNFVNNFADLNGELADELLADLESGNLEGAREAATGLRQNAHAISEHGRRADAIVKGMMAHASGESGRRERVDLNALVAEYVDLAYHGKRAQSADFEVTIEKLLDEDVGEVTIVAPDIGRVVLNLAGNAFDAVTERSKVAGHGFVPTVRVSTERNGRSALIRIEDNGVGVPADVQERIFEPFFTTKPAGSGTGLGLSLSHDIVALGHGGTLTLESRVGQGAAFIVALPVDRDVDEQR